MKKYNQFKNKTDKKHIDMLNNIYDVIVGNAYSFDSQRKLKAWRKNKQCEVVYTENRIPYIKIGRNFVLILQNKEIE